MNNTKYVLNFTFTTVTYSLAVIFYRSLCNRSIGLVLNSEHLPNMHSADSHTSTKHSSLFSYHSPSEQFHNNRFSFAIFFYCYFQYREAFYAHTHYKNMTYIALQIHGIKKKHSLLLKTRIHNVYNTIKSQSDSL